METPVHVIDVGYTRIGDHWGRSISELAYESCQKILKSSPEPPEGVMVANAVSEISSSQQNLGPLIADALQLDRVSAIEVEAAGASGAAAIHVAANMIRSGQLKSALVVGVEKMRDLDPAKVMIAQGLSENADYTQFFGVSFASINALIARLYMQKYDVSRDKLSAFPVIAHRNSSTADHAQFRKKFTAEDVSRSEIVSEPLRVLDCAPIGDGAASALLASGDVLKPEQKRESAQLISTENSSGRMNFFERENILHFGSTQTAARKALKKANLQVEDVDLFEIHDSYSILGALVVEALGLSRPGKACDDALSGKFDLDGDHPISTFGGMKARGYPIGAAGVYQLCEAYLQLTGRAKSNQVSDAKHALIQTIGGIDGSAYVHVLGAHRGSN